MAIDQLNDALRVAPGQPGLFSDLSALYGERARLEDRPDDYVASLEMADRASALAPGLPEAVFNRAIALEHLFLYDEAREAWNLYLKLDHDSSWAEEAATHIEALWGPGRHKLGKLGVQRKLLSLARTLGRNGSSLLARSSELEAANASADFKLRGEDLYMRLPFRKGQYALARGDIPKYIIKFYEIAQRYEPDKGEQGIPRIIHVLSRGLKVTQDNALSQNATAQHLEFLGRTSEAWEHRYPALAWASVQPGRVLYEILDESVRSSLKQGRVAAALDFQNRQVALAQELDVTEDIVASLLLRARIAAVLGRQDEARRDFEHAIEKMAGVSLLGRRKLAAEIDIVRGEIGANEERAKAIASDIPDVDQLVARADFDFHRGDINTAEKDLELALDEFERQREQVPPGADRVSFFDQAQALYERLAALELHLAQPGKALEVIERFRSRTLLDQLPRIPIQNRIISLTWQEICSRVPSRTLIVVYDVVEGRLVTWLVQQSGVETTARQPAWTEVAGLAGGLSKAQIWDRKEMLLLLAKLHSTLIEPWKEKLSEFDRVVFVPTRSLYEVPFAALLDPKTERLLIQDHVVAIAPSASQFVAAVARDQRMGRPLSSALLVGDPLPPKIHERELPQLQGAERELQVLGKVYEGLRVRALTRSEATPDRVLASLSEFDVAHFAVHGWGSREDPGQSRLMLSPSSSGSGEISVKDVLGLDLSRTRLVVLAACATQAGPVSPSEGSLSLAHSFLAAGVPAVIGSLWPVDDEHTTSLSIRLHQELRRGVDAASALRNAQLAELARDPDRSNWTWASFQLFGGVAAREPRVR